MSKSITALFYQCLCRFNALIYVPVFIAGKKIGMDYASDYHYDYRN